MEIEPNFDKKLLANVRAEKCLAHSNQLMTESSLSPQGRKSPIARDPHRDVAKLELHPTPMHQPSTGISSEFRKDFRFSQSPQRLRKSLLHGARTPKRQTPRCRNLFQVLNAVSIHTGKMLLDEQEQPLSPYHVDTSFYTEEEKQSKQKQQRMREITTEKKGRANFKELIRLKEGTRRLPPKTFSLG